MATENRAKTWAVGKLAKYIVGRLRVGKVPTKTLDGLKRELKTWDMREKRWKIAVAGNGLHKMFEEYCDEETPHEDDA